MRFLSTLRAAALIAATIVVAVPTHADQPVLKRFQFEHVAMAVPVRIVLYAEDEEIAGRAAQAAFARIDELDGVMSDYDPASELRRLSATSGQGRAVSVSHDLWEVLVASQELARQSEGAFDVTVGPLVRLWRRARRQHKLPTPERIEQFKQYVGYRKVRLAPDERTVELLKPDMGLDLGGIAKGYAIDQALLTLREQGVASALVDAGGDVVLGEPPPDKPGWVIGIAPLDRDAPPSRYLSLSRRAIATSGDAWQFVEIDGVRYSHLVDPHTGVGLTDHSSVTVIAPNATLADGLASAVSVLGPEKGIELIDSTRGTAAFIVRAPHGTVETHESRCWRTFAIDP